VPSFNRTTAVVIISLGLALIVSIFLTARTLLFYGRRPSTPTSAHYDNSYLFASPLQAKSDGKEVVRITVVILNSLGQGVSNQSVKLTHLPSIKVISQQSTTDDTGRATFDLVSSTPGKYTISAKTDSFSISQTLTVNYQ